MQLRPIDPSDLSLVAGWLAEKDNYQWLDFGYGTQVLTAPTLKMMAQRDIHALRVYAGEPMGPPIGLVALSNVARSFRTATLWYVLGDKRHANQGHTSRAVAVMLTFGFAELGLEAVNAWTVEHNAPSRRVLERNRFRYIGRQRCCHEIDGKTYGRLFFDLLASEHRALSASEPGLST
jgi:RimJ/RimL family protein N-acetyltransferase